MKFFILILLGLLALQTMASHEFTSEHGNLEKWGKKKKKKHKKKVDPYAKDPVNTRIYTHGFQAFYSAFYHQIFPSEDWESKCLNADTRLSIQKIVHMASGKAEEKYTPVEVLSFAQKTLTGLDSCNFQDVGLELIYHCSNEPQMCSAKSLIDSLSYHSIPMIQKVTNMGMALSKLDTTKESAFASGMKDIGTDLGYLVKVLLY